ncbi:MAG TPA: KH domain-containing protein [Candidatus Paceibacterota bacterium]|nr:KH domain-containing protein [Candidatus Paceibacterota bacterium]
MEPEQQFLEYIVKSIVDHPDDVQVVRTVDNMGVLLTLTVHPEDMGRVIGKEGKMAQLALRPLLHAVGMKHNARVNLKINEPAGGKREQEVKTIDQVVDEMPG